MAQLYIDNAKKLKVRIDNNQKIVDTVETAGGIETTLTQSEMCIRDRAISKRTLSVKKSQSQRVM